MLRDRIDIEFNNGGSLVFRTITFEKDYDRDIIQRAWDDLLPNRILIYCM